ncbi:DUF4190 domain-containing protein [Microbacterium memoriense]|uniref:DUF4190 domain-containing protein n=1 Tax=Microbacterium memoriense TaxID=2978350 RepID=A0ABT2PB96_9MICO|nr:DUF4190 domain-containing protein [Microbacterium memoriense]MCT9001841.1 DUF4190 domain-containing protein [Microbacterium memoriense]
MTDPNHPAPDAQPPVEPPVYTAPAADPTYAPPAPPAAPQAPAYGEYAAAPPSAPAYADNGYAAAPAYSAGYPAAPTPGRTMGIVALVLAIVPIGLQLVGLILGIVALVQSRKAGQKNGIALAAIIVSSVLIVLGIIATIAVVAWFATQGTDLVNQVTQCQADPSGSVVFNGVTISCQELLEQSNR